MAATVIDLTDTTAADVAAAISQLRRRTGSAALGMVLTLVVEVDERDAHDALRAAYDASREHPSRVLAVIRRSVRAPSRLDAEVRVGEDAGFGETAVLRVYGEVGEHLDSVVLPLLLPDAPVVVWWPGALSGAPAAAPLGALAQRRITDAAAAARPLPALAERAAGYRGCDTDLAWTRLTRWRTLLAAALDQPHDPLLRGEVVAARGNPSAPLLVTWLRHRLRIGVELRHGRGPGITAVRLAGERGDIAITRPDGRHATLSRPGQPDRTVALPRRSVADLLAEELRRLDDDEVYGETLLAAYRDGMFDSGRPTQRTSGRASTRPTGRAAAAPRRGRSR